MLFKKQSAIITNKVTSY